jgi:hypothetical protein
LLHKWTSLRALLQHACPGISPLRLMHTRSVYVAAATTGNANDLVELGAAADNGQEFVSLVAPLSAISFGATMAHGLRWPDVQHAPALPVVLLDWLRWLTQQCAAAPGGSSTLVLMGHNIRKCVAAHRRDSGGLGSSSRPAAVAICDVHCCSTCVTCLAHCCCCCCCCCVRLRLFAALTRLCSTRGLTHCGWT